MRRLTAAAALGLALVAAPALAAEPVVSVWYRGSPAGTPTLDDLAAIRAVGFTGVTWPSSHAPAVAELVRLAAIVGLTVVVQPEGSTLDGRLDVQAVRVGADDIPALAWRAVAGGVRVISFDPGQASGTGLGDASRPPEWLAPAVALARQLSGNATLVAELKPGPPPLFLSLRPVSLHVALLEGPRAWVVVATNVGRDPARAVVKLPRGVPYAIWVSLLDGSTIAMLDRTTGPEWTLELDAGAAAVHVIDRALK